MSCSLLWPSVNEADNDENYSWVQKYRITGEGSSASRVGKNQSFKWISEKFAAVSMLQLVDLRKSRVYSSFPAASVGIWQCAIRCK